jgi:hypothetical protein
MPSLPPALAQSRTLGCARSRARRPLGLNSPERRRSGSGGRCWELDGSVGRKRHRNGCSGTEFAMDAVLARVPKIQQRSVDKRPFSVDNRGRVWTKRPPMGRSAVDRGGLREGSRGGFGRCRRVVNKARYRQSPVATRRSTTEQGYSTGWLSVGPSTNPQSPHHYYCDDGMRR